MQTVGALSRFQDLYKYVRHGKPLPEIVELRNYASDIFSGKGLYPFVTESGETVNRETAMRVATWFTCLQVRWDSVAMLPFNVFKQTGKSKEVAVTHPAYQLLHTRPNPFQTATQFWKGVQQRRDNNGNAFAPIIRNPKGQAVRIDLIDDSSAVQIFYKDDIYYRYKGQDIASSDMLHFKGLSLDGKVGCSLTEYHAGTIGRLKAIHKFSNRSLSTNPGLYATTANQQPMSPEGKKSFRDYWGKEMQEDMPVLYNGYEIKTIGVNPKDALYLEQIKATKEDIYGITKVPPKLAQNYDSGSGLNYNNPQLQGLDFLTWTLSILLKDIEEECNYKLFSTTEQGTYFTKFNEKALLRMDADTQAKWFDTLMKNGTYSINETRENLDENPIEGGDDHFVEGNNMVPLRLLDQVILARGSKAAPAQTRMNGHTVEHS